MQSILVAGLLASAAATGLYEEHPSYDSWLKSTHGQTALKKGHAGRRATYEANLKRIKAHNAQHAAGKVTWKAGVNQFSALSPAEFKHKVIGKGINRGTKAAMLEGAEDAQKYQMSPVEAGLAIRDPAALPTDLDWRTKGVVTPVKDQGQCGSCWTFSTAETTESAVAIATGKLFTFSEQELVSCAPNPSQCGGTGGCNGATQEIGFGYYASAGITTEQSYPYTSGGGDSGTCDKSKIVPVATISGFVKLPSNDYNALMSAVNTGPVAISVAASAWQFYSGGVLSSDCGSDVDHATVLEGYGHDSNSSLDYWLVRNSWSSGWGESGYIRVARYGGTPKGEPCLVDTSPQDGDGCPGGPANITVCGLCGILSDSSYPTGAKLA